MTKRKKTKPAPVIPVPVLMPRPIVKKAPSTTMHWCHSGRVATVEEVCVEVGPGWHEPIKRLIPDLFALGWDGQICQVKEKFGGLRFYIGAGSEAMFDRITQTEVECGRLCEDCGKPGKLRGGGWIRTLCNKCAKNRGYVPCDNGQKEKVNKP